MPTPQPDTLKKILKTQHQTMQGLDARHRYLQSRRDELQSDMKRFVIKAVGVFVSIYKPFFYACLILALGEFVFLVATMRGFSQGTRPKATDGDAALAALVVLGLTLTVSILPALPLIPIAKYIQPATPKIADEIKDLEFEITENRKAHKTAKQLHDKAQAELTHLSK